jgi:hypothetical protein
MLIAAVERLTDRTVRTFLSGMDEDGAAAIEAFVLEPETPAPAETPTAAEPAAETEPMPT